MATSFCLQCRSLLGSDDSCDLCDGEVVDLETERGLSDAERAAWLVTEEQQVRGWLSSLTVIVFGVGGLVAICVVTIASVQGDWGIFPAEIIVGTVLWLASWILIVWIPERFKKTVVTRKARGAEVAAMPRKGSSVGTVRSATPLAAHALELRSGGKVTLRHGQSEGFEIVTDGPIVVVPEGRVRAFLPPKPKAGSDADRLDGTAEVLAADCGLAPRAMARIAARDEAWRWALRDGDAVRLHATTEDVLEDQPSYRQHAGPMRRVVGTAWLARP
ncbi:MAG: hypothetical protein JRI23_25100 [Deltaproteobacteria bacterium]|jgi:hypothetical protein|nr:hypothetical protein [Deltaproteobacteria bacterium]MBW2535295.1 hypothetical protein [Deltaproteobacteria bacterium]